MKVHDNITFRRNPRIWIKDKYYTVLNQRQVYLIASLPGILFIFGSIADLTALFKINSTALSILLVCFLFVYGLINLYFVILIQRTGVRLQRQKDTAKIMHKIIAEGIREYLTFRKNKIINQKTLKYNEIKSHITGLLSAFCTQYMSVYYRPEVTITLKYLKGDLLIPIRFGENILTRSQNPEHISKSFVYKAINRSGNKQSYIYVKDLAKIDAKESRMLSGFEDAIKQRALGKYKTFISIPIRSGKLPTVKESDFTSRPDLGIIGFDLPEPYGFGNLHDNEIHILLCLADLISEPVKDLIEIKKKKKWNLSKAMQN